jgi:hypothetical protein
MEKYDALDIKAESQEFLADEADRFKQIISELSNFWLIEEIKAKKHSSDKDICEGDRNTAYFHVLANQRMRKKMIPVLEGPDGPVTETKGMLDIDKDYYKELFGAQDRHDIRLMEKFVLPEEKVTPEENDMLGSRFSLEEVKEVVFDSYADEAPGPDGLSFFFYQKYWDVIYEDLMNLFDAWFEDRLDICRLNFAMITLIPKENDAITMKKFRPISLLNCSFKIFCEVLTNRLPKS